MQATLPETRAPAENSPPVEVSVVMPCLNEARTVGTCVAKAVAALEKLGVRGEVIVADNGSTDGSQDIARAHGARVIHAERRGYGSALQAGIAAAHGTYVIMGDADDSYDFTNLEPFITRLRQGDELVMGNRFRGGIKPGAMPWLHRYIGNPILTGILNLFYRTPIGDAHCGLRGFRKDSYERLNLRTPGMEFASEMVVKAALHKQKMSEVPTTLSPDGRDRPPHLRSFRDGWRHLRFLLLFCPLWLYLIPAGLLFGGGLAVMAWLTPGPQSIGSVTFDVHTMLFAMLCVLLGYQTVWLWAYAKIHGWTSGLLPADTFSLKVFRTFNLERGLLAGLGMLVVGMGLTVWLLIQWSGQELGTLQVQSTMRYALWSFTLIVLGVQTIFGSFFLSMRSGGRKRSRAFKICASRR
ncbi:MAG: glycosyltransferase family 2 protein [Gemmataceae bacterium]|nr:glycosyltransferase family 2 protein [Gemmataceae bacterium]